MAIEIYTGFVGSGKSYHAVRRGTLIADAPKGSRWVIANFPIGPKKKFTAKIPYIKNKIKEPYVNSRWIYKENDELTVDFLVRTSYEKGFNKREGSCLLIIDEAGILFNSRDWNVKGEERKAWIKFFTQSRKLGYDICLIVQDVRMLDRQIRSLAEYEVQHKKLNGWGFMSFLPITVFAGVKFWNGIKNIRGSLEMTVYMKSVAERYDTKALFGYEEQFDIVEEAGGKGFRASGGSLPPASSTTDNVQASTNQGEVKNA